MASSMLQSRMKNLLLFVPNMVVLCGKLMVDPRVPAKERLLVAGAIAYAIVPLDLIPDMIPFVGQIDDAYLGPRVDVEQAANAHFEARLFARLANGGLFTGPFPLNSGLRFSVKAVRPSLASSLANDR